MREFVVLLSLLILVLFFLLLLNDYWEYMTAKKEAQERITELKEALKLKGI